MASSPKRFLLDTVALRGFAFAHPEGLSLLMGFLNAPRLYFPREVYDFDDETHQPDEAVSELARGLRYAKRRKERRYTTWLNNAAQLASLRKGGKLVALGLNLELLKERIGLQSQFGIGRGEAAALVLARQIGATAVFLSSDGVALAAASELGVATLTLVEILDLGVKGGLPCGALEELLAGLLGARFGLKNEDAARLRGRCTPPEAGIS